MRGKSLGTIVVDKGETHWKDMVGTDEKELFD